MSSGYLLLVLPSLALASIQVEISGSYTGLDSVLHRYFRGNVDGVISDVDANSFKLDEENLKRYIKKLNKKRPDHVYLHNPTPGDLYATNNWTEVSKNVVPRSASLTRISSTTVILTEKKIENHISNQTTVNIDLTTVVNHTVTSRWKDFISLRIDKKLDYLFYVTMNSQSVGLRESFEWGSFERRDRPIVIGTKSAVPITLDPKRAAKVQLVAERVAISVEVVYHTSLIGDVVSVYEAEFNGDHVYRFGIGEVLDAEHQPQMRISTHTLEYVFYVDPKIVAVDRSSGRKVIEYSLQLGSDSELRRTEFKWKGKKNGTSLELLPVDKFTTTAGV